MNRLPMLVRFLLVALATVQSAAATTAGERLDPTRPSGTKGSAAQSADGPAEWQLNATRITPDKRIVIINGITLTEGSRLGAARVLAIGHGEALLELNGKTQTLRLHTGEVKKTR